LLTADQYRYACHHGEVRMRDIRPGTPFQFLYESWQEQDL
jgi:rubredoxin